MEFKKKRKQFSVSKEMEYIASFSEIRGLRYDTMIKPITLYIMEFEHEEEHDLIAQMSADTGPLVEAVEFRLVRSEVFVNMFSCLHFEFQQKFWLFDPRSSQRFEYRTYGI